MVVLEQSFEIKDHKEFITRLLKKYPKAFHYILRRFHQKKNHSCMVNLPDKAGSLLFLRKKRKIAVEVIFDERRHFSRKFEELLSKKTYATHSQADDLLATEGRKNLTQLAFSKSILDQISSFITNEM